MSVFRYCRSATFVRITPHFNLKRCACPPVMKLPMGITSVPLKTFVDRASCRSSQGFLCSGYRLLQSKIFLRNLCATNGKDTEKGFGKSQPDSGQKKISGKEQLKVAVRDYGATVIVFHVGISLISLGICYVLISNGLDATLVLKAVGFSESVISSNVAVGGSTFVIAYAVHKLFAPLRIAITLSAAPFIVRYLRRVGILKLPKS